MKNLIKWALAGLALSIPVYLGLEVRELNGRIAELESRQDTPSYYTADREWSA